MSLTVKNDDGSEGGEVYDLQTILRYVLAVYIKTTKKNTQLVSKRAFRQNSQGRMGKQAKKVDLENLAR